MELFINIVYVASVLAGTVVGLWLFAWATYRLIHRLKSGDSKAKSFGEWIKYVLQLLW